MFMLMAPCPSCNKFVPTGIRVADREVFKTLRFEDSEYECPNCGSVNALVRGVMMLREEPDDTN